MSAVSEKLSRWAIKYSRCSCMSCFQQPYSNNAPLFRAIALRKYETKIPFRKTKIRHLPLQKKKKLLPPSRGANQEMYKKRA
jgi:hypothetical protein